MAISSFANKLFGLSGVKSLSTMNDVPCSDLGTALFAQSMTENLYLKIIVETMERAILPKEVNESSFNLSVYDSYSPFKRGLAYLIVDAMINKKDVKYRITESDGIVKGVKLFEEITVDKNNQTGTDVLELNFTNFQQANIVYLVFALIHNLIKSVDKGVSVSQALLVKIHKLSEMIDNPSNAEPLNAQLSQLNDAITSGQAGYVDAQSSIEFASYDSKPADDTVKFLFGIISNLTGMPLSYLFGDVVTGLGSNDASDDKRLNDAIKFYFYQITNNTLIHVWGYEFTYKNIISDINMLVSMFAFVETTDLLTPEGKMKFMINNTGMLPEDINIDLSNNG